MHDDRHDSTNAGQDAVSLSAVLRDCLDAGLMGVDAARRVVMFNQRAAALCGFAAPGDVLGRPVSTLPAPLAEAVEQMFHDGKPPFTRSLKLTPPGGASPQLHLTVAATYADDGSVAGVTLVLNDLTSVRGFEQTLHHLDRLASIGTLSAGMAHEIKNAMVAVKTFLDLLIQKSPDAQLAQVVSREMHRINAIVSQMLRFAGPARPAFATLRVHDLLEQSLGLVQHHLEGRKVTVHRALGATPDAVRGDSYQLEQVFLNLFFNALDAMGPNGRLTVLTETIPADRSELPGTPALRVSVRDSGVGIPMENMGRLFEPFFTTKPNGTGLGLPITRRIVQEHRGAITVDSQPGEGATFHVTLPLAGVPAATVSP